MGTPTPQYSATLSGRLMVYSGNEQVAVGTGTNVLAFLATPSSANLAAAVTDETGSGALVFATSPTLVAPILGTPTSGTLTNCTGLLLANTVATATNDNAAAGDIGEYVSSDIASGSAVSLTTGTPANVTSISLTAGDWDVSCNAVFTTGATTRIFYARSSISATSATMDTSADRENKLSISGTGAWTPGADTTRLGVYNSRVSIGATTTIYFVVNSVFDTSTLTAHGKIWARRVR